MTRRQREFLAVHTDEVKRDEGILIYIAARKQGASAEHAKWLLHNYKERHREQASQPS